MITRRLSTLLVVLVFLSAPLAACGKGGGGSSDGVASIDGASNDSGSSDDDSDSGGGGGDRPSDQEFQDAALEYAQCMREHGVDMPDPEFGEDGGAVQMMGPESADREDMEAADEACHHIMDEVAPDAGTIDPEQQAEMQDKLLEVAQCMREKGHDMPDPEVDDQGRVTFGMGAQAGERGEGPDEEFQRDMEDCQEQAGMDMPSGRTHAGGGSTAGSGGGDA
jgi:hypothetical protein